MQSPCHNKGISIQSRCRIEERDGCGFRRLRCRLKTAAHLFSGFKIRHRLSLDRNDRSGARVASEPGRTMSDREDAEAAQFNPVAARHGDDDSVKDDVYDIIDVTMKEVPVLARNALHKLG